MFTKTISKFLSLVFCLTITLTILASALPVNGQIKAVSDPVSLNIQKSGTANLPAEKTMSGRLLEVATKGGFQTDPTIASSPRIIGLVIGAFIAFAGITFLVLMIIAGYGWMTASGNEEKVKKATSTIRTCIIGLIVSLSGYILWNFIFDTLLK